MRFQKGALFQMQLYVAFQLDRTGIVGMTALQYNAAAACCVAGINGRLDCSGIIGCAMKTCSFSHYQTAPNRVGSAMENQGT